MTTRRIGGIITYIFPLMFFVALSLNFQQSRAQNVELLVDFPTPPDQITRLDERCNYIVDNYWKHFNFKGAFSSLERMDATLGQFLSVTPYATADTVHAAINTLIRGVEKANAKNLIPLAQMAQKWCGTDSAEYQSEELMLPFAQAVADCKKLKGSEKEYYAAMAKRLTNSRTGVAPADFEFVSSDGSGGRLSEITEPTILLMFYDPDDFGSRVARTRVGNDFVVKTLTQHKLLKVGAIYPGQPSQKWIEDLEGMPDDWVTGAAPGIDEWFTIRSYPQYYYLDENRVITDKDFSTDAILIYFNQFLQKR